MSGIYIPGMGMPQRDEVITIYPDGTAHRHHLGLRLRISESKAIPVPDHGRLIDADATEKLFRGMGAEVWDDSADIIADAPTIIPEDFAKDTNVPTKLGEAGE